MLGHVGRRGRDVLLMLSRFGEGWRVGHGTCLAWSILLGRRQEHGGTAGSRLWPVRGETGSSGQFLSLLRHARQVGRSRLHRGAGAAEFPFALALLAVVVASDPPATLQRPLNGHLARGRVRPAAAGRLDSDPDQVGVDSGQRPQRALRRACAAE